MVSEWRILRVCQHGTNLMNNLLLEVKCGTDNHKCLELGSPPCCPVEECVPPVLDVKVAQCACTLLE